MKILSIETSCDETAAAVFEFRAGRFRILSSVVASSVELQAEYGGIVPEVAARKQMEYMMLVLEQALKYAFPNSKEKGSQLKKNIDYIAVTSGPGLITSLRVGVETAKTLSYAWNKKLLEINHLEGHIYSSLLNNLKIYNFVGKVRVDQSFTAIKRIKFPALALIVSGGHTQLVMLRDYLKYKIIGETVDDAAGEAFDKVAKILGLGYPGGPVVSRAAKDGDSGKINFPRPMINSDDYNFSFSGLKTAVLYYVKSQPSLSVKVVNDICANFEQACVEVLVHKTIKAALNYGVKTVLLGGGVAANNQLRQRLEINLKQKMPKCIFLAPEIKWTGDNAAMIALAGYYKIKANKFADWKKVKTEANLRLR